MRILEVFEPLVGGVHVYVRTLTEGLTARGHEVHVATAPDQDALDALRALGAVAVGLPLRAPMLSPWEDARVLAALTRIMRRGRYDVVHVHDTKAGALGRPAAVLSGRGSPVAYSPHAFAYSAQHLRDRRHPALRRALTLNIERALSPLSAAIVLSSEAERRQALADRVASPGRLRVLLPGVPDGVASPPAELASMPRPRIGFLARLERQKGPDVLVAALHELAVRGLRPSCAIVGNGEMAPGVRAAVESAGLARHVRLLPFVPPVWPYLAALDIFVLPSRWEGLPVGVLEAMAAGLPVVASAVDGTPEAVEDGATGLLVPSADPGALADALERLCTETPLRARFGAAGRARYQRLFTAEAMVARAEALYTSL